MDFTELGPIIVGGFDYEIVYDTKRLRDDCNAGVTESHYGTITLRDDYNPQFMMQTLLHEIQHAIGYTWLGWEPLDEKQVEALAQGWFQVLRDNPRLLRAIQALNDKEGDDDGE